MGLASSLTVWTRRFFLLVVFHSRAPDDVFMAGQVIMRHFFWPGDSRGIIPGLIYDPVQFRLIRMTAGFLRIFPLSLPAGGIKRKAGQIIIDSLLYYHTSWRGGKLFRTNLKKKILSQQAHLGYFIFISNSVALTHMTFNCFFSLLLWSVWTTPDEKPVLGSTARGEKIASHFSATRVINKFSFLCVCVCPALTLLTHGWTN